MGTEVGEFSMGVLHILLWMLNAIGVLLGGMLGILLLLICILFIVPVRYTIKAKKETNLYVDVEITWFLRAGYYRFTIKNNNHISHIFRLFGKTLFRKKEIDSKNIPKKVEEEMEERKQHVKEKQETTAAELLDHKERKEAHGSRHSHKRIKKEDHETADEILTIKEKIKDLGEELEEQVVEKDSFGIKDILQNPHKKQIVHQVWKFLKKIYRGIKPRKIHMDLELGTGDPGDTGYILGCIGIISPYCGNDIKIKGNFEQQILHGRIYAVGKCTIGYVGRILLQFIFAKPIWRLIKQYLRKRKDGV